MTDSTTPLLSVIIPTYNRAHLLGRAVSSVLSQSFAAFELLIIDDHSTDNTEQVVAQWDDPRIRYLRHAENRGSSATRNCGIRAAQAEFITFLDDDDEFLPDALAMLYQALSNTPTNVAYVVGGIVQIIDTPQGEIVDGVHFPQVPPQQSREAIYLRFLSRLTFGTGWGVLFRRHVFDTIGLFDEQLFVAIDRDLFLRLALHFDLIVLNQSLVKVHLHNAPQLTDPTIAHVVSRELILQKHQQMLQQHPRIYSSLLYGLALGYYRFNQKAEARRLLWQATRRDPFRSKAWLSFLYYELLQVFSGAIHQRLGPRRTEAQRLLPKYR
ncbi:MAG: glycosyltransferase family 2 protein [Caldilineaceae bacterium]|nr:glycosyltransferase family 2 protein [Caldilineaceae bacterium]